MEASTTRGRTALVYYIQVLYTGGGVHPTGRTVTMDVASSPQTSLYEIFRELFMIGTYDISDIKGVIAINFDCNKFPKNSDQSKNTEKSSNRILILS